MTVSSPSSPSTPVESYLITLPRLRIDGLWYGSPYTELADTSHIIGGGHVVTLEYKGKGYFSGKSHSFKATVTPMPGHGQGRDDIVVEGTWHENSKFTRGAAGSFHDTDDHVKEEVVPLKWTEEAGELETRKLWHLVAKGIREGDFDLASQEKSRIEVIVIFYAITTVTKLYSLPCFFWEIFNKQNDQRQRRKDEQAAGTTWPLKHFNHEISDPICQSFFLFFFAVYAAKLYVSDEQLGRLIKINPAIEDAYVFKDNWLSSFKDATAPQ